jgi:hypothetical protein
VYKGLAVSEKPGIQSQQYPAAPKNSHICLLVFGGGILRIASIHPLLRIHFPWVRS